MLSLTALAGALLVSVQGAEVPAFDGNAASRSGDLVVFYRVEEGFRVSLRVEWSGAVAYTRASKTDVTRIGVEFVDLDADGREDVIVTYVDEGGYSIVPLVRRGTGKVVDALRGIGRSVHTYTDIDADEKGVRRAGGHSLVPFKGERAPRLVVRNVSIGGQRYQDAVFRLDVKSGEYSITSKGKRLADDGDGEL